MDHSPPGCSVLGISQAGRLEWVAISFSGDVADQGLKLGLLHFREILTL